MSFSRYGSSSFVGTRNEVRNDRNEIREEARAVLGGMTVMRDDYLIRSQEVSIYSEGVKWNLNDRQEVVELILRLTTSLRDSENEKERMRDDRESLIIDIEATLIESYEDAKQSLIRSHEKELTGAVAEIRETTQDLIRTRKELAQTTQELAQTREELIQTKGNLGRMTLEMTKAEKEIQSLRQAVSDYEARLN